VAVEYWGNEPQGLWGWREELGCVDQGGEAGERGVVALSYRLQRPWVAGGDVKETSWWLLEDKTSR
jgi:hypothetical protein